MPSIYEPNFTKYYLPVFPTANHLVVENDIEIKVDGGAQTVPGFGRISVQGERPETYYFFGRLTADYIAGKAFVRANLVLSAGLHFLDAQRLSTAVRPGEASSIDLNATFPKNSLGDVTDNKLIPLCCDIVEDTGGIGGFDFDFCVPTSGARASAVMGGGNGICTKVFGAARAASDLGFGRPVFYLPLEDMPPSYSPREQEKPDVRLRAICGMDDYRSLRGYFFMPMLCPDLSILYYCYPNAVKADTRDVHTRLDEWLKLDRFQTITVKNFQVYPFEEFHAFLTEAIA